MEQEVRGAYGQVPAPHYLSDRLLSCPASPRVVSTFPAAQTRVKVR